MAIICNRLIRGIDCFQAIIKDLKVINWKEDRDHVLKLLRNAFIQALYPSLENSINLDSVGKPLTRKEKKAEKKRAAQGIAFATLL